MHRMEAKSFGSFHPCRHAGIHPSIRGLIRASRIGRYLPTYLPRYVPLTITVYAPARIDRNPRERRPCPPTVLATGIESSYITIHKTETHQQVGRVNDNMLPIHCLPGCIDSSPTAPISPFTGISHYTSHLTLSEPRPKAK